MAQIPLTLSELEGHFCCYDWQNMSRSPSACAELLIACHYIEKYSFSVYDCKHSSHLRDT